MLSADPPSATGLYPMPIWGAGLAIDPVGPVKAVGRYPAPVWPASASGLAADTGDALNSKQADYRDEVDDTAVSPVEVAGNPAAILDNREIYVILREVAVSHSGADLYAAMRAQDGFGLCFGIVLFPQATGHLGKVLQLMRARDSAVFSQVFGPAGEEAIAVTNSDTWEQRLRPVGGSLMTSDAWQSRFKAAGAVAAFQAAQNEGAIEEQFRPMLTYAAQLGCDTDRSLAMLYDQVVTSGLGGAVRWTLQNCGPLSSQQQQAFALDALGHDDLRSFQDSVGLTPTGVFTPQTYLALLQALRSDGCPLPSAEDLSARMVAAATGSTRGRLARLRDSGVLSGTVYDLTKGKGA